MKNYLIIFLVISSCSLTKKIESPVIYISNSSSRPINNIQCQLPNHIVSIKTINPGQNRSQSFYMKKHQDFFGDVKCFWDNNLGERKIASFAVEPHHLPSIKDKYEYPFLQIFLEQDSYEIYTNDSIDYLNKSRVMDEKMKKSYRQAILDKYGNNPDSSLIDIQNKDMPRSY